MRYCILVFLFTASTPSMHAAVFKCESNDGNITYQATPCADTDVVYELEIQDTQTHADPPHTQTPEPIDLRNNDSTSPHPRTFSGANKNEHQLIEQKQGKCRQLEQRYAQEKSRAEAASSRIIAECKQNRETYCNNSAEEILKRNQSRDDARMMAESKRVQNNYHRIKQQQESRHINTQDLVTHYRQERQQLGCDNIN